RRPRGDFAGPGGGAGGRPLPPLREPQPAHPALLRDLRPSPRTAESAPWSAASAVLPPRGPARRADDCPDRVGPPGPAPRRARGPCGGIDGAPAAERAALEHGPVP